MELTLSNTGTKLSLICTMELLTTPKASYQLQLIQLPRELRSQIFHYSLEIKEDFKITLSMKVSQQLREMALRQLLPQKRKVPLTLLIKERMSLVKQFIQIQFLIHSLFSMVVSWFIWSVSCTHSWVFLWSPKTISIQLLIQLRRRVSLSQIPWMLLCWLSPTLQLKVSLWSTVSFSVCQILEFKQLCSKLPSLLWLSKDISIHLRQRILVLIGGSQSETQSFSSSTWVSWVCSWLATLLMISQFMF